MPLYYWIITKNSLVARGVLNRRAGLLLFGLFMRRMLFAMPAVFGIFQFSLHQLLVFASIVVIALTNGALELKEVFRVF
jgi:hypothetical protein